MSGPPPKDADQRVRRNAAKYDYASATLPAEGRKGPAPKPTVKLDPAEAATWRRLWKSPMATMWSVDDVEALTRYVKLARSDAALSVPAVIAELRQTETLFGLNPKGRQNLRWKLAEPHEPPSAGSTPPDDLADYSYLKAV